MTVGFIIVCLLFTILFLSAVRKAAGKTELFPLVILLVLTAVSGLRYDVGVDYPVYREVYDSPSDIRALAFEPFWIFFSEWLRDMGFASRMWFILTSAAINLLMYYGIKRMSVNPYLSLLLYVVMSFGYVETFNMVRQYVAIGILFATFHYVTENKVWKYLLFIVLAACFHLSALLMLPFLLLMRIRYPIWLLWIVFCTLFFFGRQLLTVFLNYVIPFIPTYGFYADRIILEDYSGFLKLFYFFVGCGILAVAPYLTKRYATGSLYINAVLMALMWYFVFIDIQVFMRGMFYLVVFLFILIPMLTDVLAPRTRMLLTPLIVLLFLTVTLKMHWSVPYNFDFQLFY